MTKIDYLAVLFDNPPSGQQLSRDFGGEGWKMIAIVPVLLEPEEEGGPTRQKLQAYFQRPVSQILVPVP